MVAFLEGSRSSGQALKEVILAVIGTADKDQDEVVKEVVCVCVFLYFYHCEDRVLDIWKARTFWLVLNSLMDSLRRLRLGFGVKVSRVHVGHCKAQVYACSYNCVI